MSALYERGPAYPSAKEIDQQFLEEAFRQTKEAPFRYAKVTGKFLGKFIAIRDEHHKMLQAIDPSLPANIFNQKFQFDDDDLSLHYNTNDLSQSVLEFAEKKHRIRTIIDSHNRALALYARDTILPELATQQLPHGIVKTPLVYYRQKSGRTCYLTSYAMVFTALTGHTVDESTIINAAAKNELLIKNTVEGVYPVHDSKRNTRNLDVPEEHLLAVLRTPVFRERFGEAGVIKFAGADFNDIARCTNNLKTKAAERGKTVESFFIARSKSEVISTGTHTPILLAADQHWVQIHDPSNQNRKLITKNKFISLWAQKHLRGDYIFALKPKRP